MGAYDEFISKFSSLTGLDPSVVAVWVSREQGVNNNVLGLTYATDSGRKLYTFQNQTEAAVATASLINTSPLYSSIRNAAKTGTTAQQAYAIATSPWRLGTSDLQKYGGIDPYYYKGFVEAGILGSSSKPSGGVSTPITDLGGWGNLVSFPEGHILTQSDVDNIVNTLWNNGMFGDPSNPATAGTSLTAMAVFKKDLASFIGKPWNKDLQNQIQGTVQASATEAGKPLFNFDIPGVLMFLAVVLIGITFIIVGGIITLRKNP